MLTYVFAAVVPLAVVSTHLQARNSHTPSCGTPETVVALEFSGIKVQRPSSGTWVTSRVKIAKLSLEGRCFCHFPSPRGNIYFYFGKEGSGVEAYCGTIWHATD